MKNLKLSLFLVVMIFTFVGGIFLTSCETNKSMEEEDIVEKNYSTEINKKNEIAFYKTLKIDTTSIKDEVYLSLDYFQNISCNNTNEVAESMKSYFEHKGVKNYSYCNLSETNKFLSTLTANEQLDYLKKNNYISDEINNLLKQYFSEIEISDDANLTKIIDKYIILINNNKKISSYEKNKLLLGFYVSKNTLEYFETNMPKGLTDCKNCIWSNRKSILSGSGIMSVIGTIACVRIFWNKPIFIPVCIIANASFWVYFLLADICIQTK